MKQKISITLEKDVIEFIERNLQDGRFRNRSHVVEYSLRKFIGENRNESKNNISRR